MIGVAAALAVASPALAATFDEIQVTSDPSVAHKNPVVSSGRIAYTSPDASGVAQIFLYDVAAGTTRQITNDSSNDTLEDMDGNYIVFAHVGTTVDINGYDLTLGQEFPVTTAAGAQTNPAISGSSVIWQDNRTAATAADIYGADLAGAAAVNERALNADPANQTNPRISGNWIVWQEPNGVTGNSDVYAEDLTTATVVGVSVGGQDAIQPDIDGTTVVYAGGVAGGAHDIYAFDLLSRATTRLSTSAADEQKPRISGTFVVWEDHRNAGTSTCGASGTSACGIDLYGVDTTNLAAGDTALETSAGDQFLEDIQGDDIAFTDTRSGQDQIYDLHRAGSTGGTGSGDPCDPANGAPVLYSATYTRGHGQPQTVSATFASGFSSGTVCLGLTHVSSAEIDLNGSSVFGPSDFNPNETAAQASVSLQLSNTLAVTLRGKPCDGGCGGNGDGDDGDGDGHGHGHHHGDHGSCGDDTHACHVSGYDEGGDHHHHGHHDGDDDEGDGHGEGHGEGNGSGSGNGSTCSTIDLRVVGPVPAPATVTAPPNTVATLTCDVGPLSTGFDLRLVLPLLLCAGAIVARRRRA